MSKVQQRSRLGRGLNALLNGGDEGSEAAATTPPAVLDDTGVAKDENDAATASVTVANESSNKISGQSTAIEAKVANDSASSTDNLTEDHRQRGTEELPASESPADERLLMLEPQAVLLNPRQPRKAFDDVALSELAASLKKDGLLQPIVVRSTGGRYELIAGERRLRAATLAGLTVIQAVVREADDIDQAHLALIENIHRSDLNPIERASAYNQLLSDGGLTQAELADRLGEQRSSIANHLRLLDLTEPVQDLLLTDKLSLGHAKVLAGVAESDEQFRLATACVSQGLSVRNLERMVKGEPSAVTTREEKSFSAAVNSSSHLQELERELSTALGLKVTIRSRSASRGTVMISYSNLDEFDVLLQKLGVELTG